MPKTYRNTALVVIYNKHKEILLCLSPRDDHDWKMPQGGIEEGETARTAVIRELNEELNISIKPEDIKEKIKTSISYYFANGFEVKLHPFLVAWNKKYKIRLNPEEFSEYRWINPEKIKEYKLGVRKEAYTKILEQFKLKK